jgi:hypothetical protein
MINNFFLATENKFKQEDILMMMMMMMMMSR